MKILDVHDFHTGLKEIEETLSSQKDQVKDIQKSVQAVVDLEDAFKGKGGEAIRGFYRNKHLPMIEQYQTFLADYETTIGKLRNAIQDVEPAPHGVIKQSFLDHEVEGHLHRAKQTTIDMTNEANATIQRVSDIVSIPTIQDGDFLQQVANAQREKAQTVEKLHVFDRNQTANLSSLEEQVQELSKQITMLQSVYRMGKVDIIEGKSTFKKKDSFLSELSDVAAAKLSKKYSKTLGAMEGAGLALFDIVMDTIESLLYLFTDPIGFFQGIFHALLHPIDTFKYIWGGIEQSFEEEVVQGDERSRERYVSYTATYIGASLYGLKGTDKVSAVSKTGRAGMVTKAGKKGSKKDIPYNVMATAAFKSLIKKGVTISFDIVEDTPKQLLSSKTGHQALTLNRVSKRLEENLIKTKNVLNSDAVKNVMEKTYQSVVRSAISKVARSEIFNGVRKLVMNENGHVKFSWKKEDRKSGTEGSGELNKDLAKAYMRDIEAKTGRKVNKEQVHLIKEALRNKNYEKLTPKETAKHRSKFTSSLKDKLIAEWEEKTNQKWPRYTEEVLDKNGEVARSIGQPYDAHHIIENNFGGPHEWWNIHPAKYPNEHQAGIHGKGAPSGKLFPRR
ncbi:LXG domain-containing protein [Rossellomorea marisflavi]|uniref:LXG domain-containing protein n=1 Tax=Rossellomorea marisflavi TaxID=189381 RepID=UPI0025582475|nr:LXG domain-containing protein [Rossellomorea marisflavi]